MFEDMIRAPWAELKFKRVGELASFLTELEKESVWIHAKIPPYVRFIGKGETPVADPTGEWEDEAFSLVFNDGNGEREGVLNSLTAPLSLSERAGAKCVLTQKLIEQKSLMAGDILTVGMAMLDAKPVILLRGGRVTAVHSARYRQISQKKSLETVAKAMEERFPEGKFLGGAFDPNTTEFSYSVCDGNGEFLKAYKEAWTRSGMPEEMLLKTFPVIIFSTSDTGLMSFTARPVLKIGGITFPLGEPVRIKHVSRDGEKETEHIIDRCFSLMQTSIEKVVELHDIRLLHPFAVFVRACDLSGLTGKAKSLLKDALHFMKYTYNEEDVSAFQVYSEICGIQYGGFSSFSPASRIQILECLNRLLTLNWKELDRFGPEYFA